MLNPSLDHSSLSIRKELKLDDEILLDINYHRISQKHQEEVEIILFTRGKNRLRNRYFVNNFLPYIYVETDEIEFMKIVRRSELVSSWFVSAETTSKIEYRGGEQINLLKIYGKQPWIVPSIRSVLKQYHIRYYEADIPFTHRFMIDVGLGGLRGVCIDENSALIETKKLDATDFNPRVTSIDLEIDSSVNKDEGKFSFATVIKQASRRITGIGFVWNLENGEEESKIFVLDQDTNTDEKAMILQALDFLWKKIDPDVIVTYNGDVFDFPYLLKRMEVLEIPLTLVSPYEDQEPLAPAYGNGWKIPGVLVFDLYKRTRWIYTADGRKTLNSIANELLGASKIDIHLDHGELWKQSLTSKKQRDLFLNYLKRDVELTYRLWHKMNMPEWLEVIKISGAPPGDGMYFTERQTGEFLVFHTMFQNNILIPPAPTPEERKQRKKDRVSAKGGLVLEPKRDLSTAVIIYDFTSMYPSIIAAHNVGAEAFNGMEGEPKYRFKDSPKTSMAIMQEQMLNRRIDVKKQLQDPNLSEINRRKLFEYNWAVKLVANSTYGGYNYIGSRFYDTNIAQTITAIGRDYLSLLSEKVKEFKPGYETIYGDTDSVFIETPLANKIEKLMSLSREETMKLDKHVPEVKELMNFLIRMLPEQMRLELHDIAYRIIFHRGAKKRYAYVSAISKNLSILGFEAIRHDWSPFAKTVQKKAFDLILRTGSLEKTKKDMIVYIQHEMNTTGEQLKNLVTTFGPVKKKPQKYKSQTPAIAAFIHHVSSNKLDPEEEAIKIDYFPFIITQGTGPLKNRARHPEYVDWKEIDLDYYIDEALRTINRFNLNISLNEVKGIKYKSLTEFFTDAKKID
jgi:DNA polymerase elongation subunit (family B)